MDHVSKMSRLKKVIVANCSYLETVVSQKVYFCKVIMSQKVIVENRSSLKKKQFPPEVEEKKNTFCKASTETFLLELTPI